MTRQVIAHTDLYNNLCLFSRRAQAHAKRAHPHANSTTNGRHERKSVYASRLAVPLNKSFVRRESAK